MSSGGDEASFERQINSNSIRRPYLKTFWLLLLGVLAIIALILGLSSGAVSVSVAQIITGESSELERTVFSEIRSPRVVLAGLVGASLAIAGAVLQGLFRNPLADPGLIGVSSGAALGAIAMIVVGSALSIPESVLPFSLPLAAITGAIVVTLFLYAFAAYFGQFSILTVLLVGIAVNALAGVGIGAFQYLSDDSQLRTLVFWMMGSFGRANWESVLPAAIVMGIGITVLFQHAKNLDRLQLGEAEAAHLGVDVKQTKRIIILLSAAIVGAGVSLSGIIGFVGLVVPHLARLMLGSAHSLVLPGSIMIGLTLMIMADLVARTLAVPAEIPVSLVTSALGAPFFLWLIARARPR